MILLLFIILQSDAKIDSLKKALSQNPQLPTLVELHNCYLKAGSIKEDLVLLKEYESVCKSNEKPFLMFIIGDDHLFAGNVLLAREEYLRLVAKYPSSENANDALERLYLIESARKDTALLKKLTHSIFLYYVDELNTAEDSLKNLLETKLAAHAYFYLALVYVKKNDLPLALGALKELNKSYPDHKIHNATLLLAEVLIESKNKKEAKEVLENLLVEKPTSIYAVRAREILKQHF